MTTPKTTQVADDTWEQRTSKQQELFLAVRATMEANKLQLAFAELFGKRAVFVQGNTRFEARRVLNTTYIIDRRLADRRNNKKH